MVYLIIVLVLALIEYLMSARWFSVYFKYGIPIYRKSFTGKALALAEIDGNYLNDISKNYVLMFVSPLVFNKLSGNEWAFRQQSFRTSIIHGKLFSKDNNFHLIGYLNWWALFLGGISIQRLIQHKDYFLISILILMFLLYYFLEKKMFKSLINHFSENN